MTSIAARYPGRCLAGRDCVTGGKVRIGDVVILKGSKVVHPGDCYRAWLRRTGPPMLAGTEGK